MNCKFCGAPMEDGLQQCPACNKLQAEEITEQTHTPTTAELIDNMPELHDELDRIGEMRRRAEKRPRRVLLAVLLVALCLVVAGAGMLYFHNKEAQRKAQEAAPTASSAVAGQVKTVLLSGEEIPFSVLDAQMARDAITSALGAYGAADENVDFILTSMYTVEDDTYYRFNQMWNNISVYGGSVVVSASKDGQVYGINASIVETAGLENTAALNEGAAGNAISAYISKLPPEYRVVDGISMTDIKKVVCNQDGNTHLAYVKNISGYNEKGEYTALDALVDASSGNGIMVRPTVSFEPETAQDKEPAIEPATQLVPEETLPDAAVGDIPADRQYSAAAANMAMFAVSDKFNWNDKTMEGALESLDLAEIENGNASGYLISAKRAVDKAYAYFASRLGHSGFDGENSKFSVLINANEYVKDRLPIEQALCHKDTLVFFQQDMTAGTLADEVAVHEYSHGVLSAVANFDGTMAATENAALAEGLADAFGELAQIYFTGNTDWVHGERNIPTPAAGYLTVLPGQTEIYDMTGCYYYSTVASHAVYQMFANGVPEEALGQLLMRSVYFMTDRAGFAQWRAAMELSAYAMEQNGSLTAAQRQIVTSAFDQSGIEATYLAIAPAAAPVDQIPAEIE